MKVRISNLLFLGNTGKSKNALIKNKVCCNFVIQKALQKTNQQKNYWTALF